MPSYHVLVVDDDPLVCKGLKFHLEQGGYKVSTASTAHMAVELSQRIAFDVAILDIVLPDDDGLELCKKLKTQRDIPVIFLTARRRELDEIIGLEVGGDDYITKPFSADVLMSHLRAVLRRTTPPGLQASRCSPGAFCRSFCFKSAHPFNPKERKEAGSCAPRV